MNTDTLQLNDTKRYFCKSDSLVGLTRSDPDFRSLVKMLNQSRHESLEPLPILRNLEPLDPEEITSQILSEICDDLLEPSLPEVSTDAVSSFLYKESNDFELLEPVPIRSTISVPAVAIDRKREFEESDFISSVSPPEKKQRCASPSDSSYEDASGNRFRCYQEAQWREKFEELCEFMKQNGHSQVPHAYPKNEPLARWTKRQRYQYKLKQEGKASTMTDDRISALNELGFVWDSHGSLWEERLNELREFHRTQGHSNVPSQYDVNQKLATWVKCQRRQYKLFVSGRHSNMTLDRVSKLEVLDFVWEVRCCNGSR